MSVKTLLSYTVLIIGLLSASCTTDPDLTGVPEISFKNQVQPILSSGCGYHGCHGREIGNYNEVMDFGKVKAGNAHGSTLYRVMTGRDPFNVMPPSGYTEISAENLKLIYLWIEQGAKNN